MMDSIMSTDDMTNYITRCIAFGLEPVIDGWIYTLYDGLPCVVGFDKSVYDLIKDKRNKSLVFNNYCNDIIFDFDSMNICLQSFIKNKYIVKKIVIDIFTINNIKVLKSIGQLNFVNSLCLPDTEELSDYSLLNSTIRELSADKVTILGKKCIYGCNNLEILSLKSLVNLKLNDIENLRCLIRINKLYLGDGAKIVDENYYTIHKGRNVVFELLDLSNVKKISSNILIHLLESYKVNCINLPNLEEIVMYKNSLNLNHSFSKKDIYLDKLKELDSDLLYRLSCHQNCVSLQSLCSLKENALHNCNIEKVFLHNVKNMDDLAINNCRIKELYLDNLEVLNLNSFYLSEVKVLYLNKNCKIDERKDLKNKVGYKPLNEVFHEIHRI